MKHKICIALHSVIILTTVWAVAVYFNGTPDVLGSTGTDCFKYFTTDSNILACIASILYLVYAGRKDLPKWVVRFRFASVVAVAITFLTVVFFLAPMAAMRGRGLVAFGLFFKGNVFVLHFSTPVLALAAALIPQRMEEVSRREVLLGVIPVAIYSVVYLVMVVFLQHWNDWYGFTFGGRYGLIPVVIIVMGLFAYGVSAAIRAVKTALQKHV